MKFRKKLNEKRWGVIFFLLGFILGWLTLFIAEKIGAGHG